MYVHVYCNLKGLRAAPSRPCLALFFNRIRLGNTITKSFFHASEVYQYLRFSVTPQILEAPLNALEHRTSFQFTKKLLKSLRTGEITKIYRSEQCFLLYGSVAIDSDEQHIKCIEIDTF